MSCARPNPLKNMQLATAVFIQKICHQTVSGLHSSGLGPIGPRLCGTRGTLSTMQRLLENLHLETWGSNFHDSGKFSRREFHLNFLLDSFISQCCNACCVAGCLGIPVSETRQSQGEKRISLLTKHSNQKPCILQVFFFDFADDPRCFFQGSRFQKYRIQSTEFFQIHSFFSCRFAPLPRLTSEVLTFYPPKSALGSETFFSW